MPQLLREGARVPDFTLRTPEGKAVRYAGLLRARRIALLVLSEKPGAWDNARDWLRAAAEAEREFAERDMTVLVLLAPSGEVPEVRALPRGGAGVFFPLSDPDGAVRARLGGAPAFYLIGKDTGIKQASRTCPPLKSLFGLIDAMPMRRKEMRGPG